MSARLGMRDPHVEALHYQLRHSDDIDYLDAKPCEISTAAFTLSLTADGAVVRPSRHHADAASAREEVEPFIRSWETLAALLRDPDEFSLEFDSAHVVDRDPPPAAKHIDLHAAIHAHAKMSATLHVSRGTFPPPPLGFSASPEVQVMAARFAQYQRGREPLASMAYFVLTAISMASGGRRAAAAKLGVDRPVLNRLAELVSGRGGPVGARKAPMGEDFTREERVWITEVVKSLIRRSGEQENAKNGELPRITMEDLPHLSGAALANGDH